MISIAYLTEVGSLKMQWLVKITKSWIARGSFYNPIFTGNESKCPVGETSDNGGFTPGCECKYQVL